MICRLSAHLAIAEVREAAMQELMDKIGTRGVAAVAGLVLIVIGGVLSLGIGMDYAWPRPGLAIIGIGVCGIGYWALSSNNDSYNF
jgi:hypothetical protein